MTGAALWFLWLSYRKRMAATLWLRMSAIQETFHPSQIFDFDRKGGVLSRKFHSGKPALFPGIRDCTTPAEYDTIKTQIGEEDERS